MTDSKLRTNVRAFVVKARAFVAERFSWRFRYVVIFGSAAMVIAGLLWTDPDKGATTGFWLLTMGTASVVTGIAHLLRKALFDYPEADAQSLFRKAAESPVGAGLALVALALVLSALLGMVGKARAATGASVPPQSAKYLPTVRVEMRAHWPALPWLAYVPALIHHESGCPGLRSCWSPTARLKTQREEGAGLGQLTRAWRPDGSLRFDALAEMRAAHPALAGLSWDTIYTSPALQIRAVVLKLKSDWDALSVVDDYWQRLLMTDAAYNGGRGGLQNERRACGMSPPCNPQLWEGHVENRCLKSRSLLYGSRSACDINRDHVRIVTRAMPLYRRSI